MKSVCCFILCLVYGVSFLPAQDFASPLTNPFSLSQQGARVSPAFADIDMDGDLDLFTGQENGAFGFYPNNGSVVAPSYGVYQANPFGISSLSGNSTPFLVDLDGDDDFDILAGSDSGLRYFENTGNATNASYGPAVVNPFLIISPIGIVKPYMADIDNDDDMDLFVGASDGNIYFYENTGNSNAPAFAAAVVNPFGLQDVGERSAPALIDLDNDNDLDVLVGNQQPGNLSYFENTGTLEIPAFNYVGTNPFNLESVAQDAKPYFGDLDSDSDHDLLVGNASGDLIYFENISPTAGIDEFDKANAAIYPNPFTDYTTIEFKNNINRHSSLLVTDSSGKVLLKINLLSGNDKIVLSKKELGVAQGVFFAFLLNNSKSFFLGKIVTK